MDLRKCTKIQKKTSDDLWKTPNDAIFLLISCVIPKSTSCLYSWEPRSGKQSEINKHFKFRAFDNSVLGEINLIALRWLLFFVCLVCVRIFRFLFFAAFLFGFGALKFFYRVGLLFFLRNYWNTAFLLGKNLSWATCPIRLPLLQQPWWQWSDPCSELLQHHPAENRTTAFGAGCERKAPKFKMWHGYDLAPLLCSLWASVSGRWPALAPALVGRLLNKQPMIYFHCNNGNNICSPWKIY